VVVDSYNKRENKLAVFKKMDSFKGFFSTELISIVLQDKRDISLILFGAGRGGLDVKSFLDECNDKLNSNFIFQGLMDNKQSLWGKYLYDLQVIEPDSVTVEVDYVLVASLWGHEIQQQLINLGVEKKTNYTLLLTNEKF